MCVLHTSYRLQAVDTPSCVQWCRHIKQACGVPAGFLLSGWWWAAAAAAVCASASTVQISPEQGQFMALLVKLMGVKNAIEVRLQR
jgi:hypothetical protein